jgi:hypothetical protein
MVNTLKRGPKLMILVAVLAATVLNSDLGASAQQAPADVVGAPPSGASAPLEATPPTTSLSPSSVGNWHAFESSYYKRKWGIDIIGVRLVSSGSMLRFTYRVLDADKARMLNDKRWNPYLVDGATGAKLGVPEMEMVGKLRQTASPEKGRIYWMVFGNPNRLVKAGNQVDVVIGSFRAEGMVVE